MRPLRTALGCLLLARCAASPTRTVVIPWPEAPTAIESPALSLTAQQRAQSATFVTAQRACDDGAVSACVALAELYIHGRGVDADLHAARAILAPLCEAQHEPACLARASLDLRSRMVSVAMRARAEVEARCAQRRDEWCELYADALSLGLGGPIERASIEPALRAACADPHPRACGALALWLIERASSDRAEVRSIATRACDRRSARGCIALALLDPDERASTRRLEQLCESGEGRACSLAARRWREADPARSEALFREGCLFARGAASGCGAWALDARGAPFDLESSVGLLLRSCEIERDPRACDQYVRRAIAIGRTSAIDPVESWLAPICQDGAREVCVALASWPGRARTAADVQVLRDGCDRGDVFACGSLGAHLLATDEAERGLALLDASCAQRDRRACRALVTRGRSEGSLDDGAREADSDESAASRDRRARASRTGCALGDPACCTAAIESARSPAESRAIRRTACAAGVVGRCDR